MEKIKGKKLITSLMTIAIAGTISCVIPTKSNAAINLAPRIYQKSSSSSSIVLEFKDNSGLKSVKVNDKEVISNLKNQKKSGSKITSGTYEINKTKETSKTGVDYTIVVEDLSGKKFTDPITTYYSTNLKKLYMNRAPRISITGKTTSKGYYKTGALKISDNSKFNSVKLYKKIDGTYKKITDFSKVPTATMKDKEGKQTSKLEDAVELSFALKSIGVGSYKIEAIDKTGKKQTRTFNVIDEASSSTNTTTKEETDKKEDTTTNKEGTDKKEDATTNTEVTDKKEDATTNTEGTDKKEDTTTTTEETDKKEDATTNTEGTDKKEDATTNTEGTDKKEDATTTTEETDKKENTTTTEETTSKEYRYIQNIDRGPRYSLDLSNKDYVLIKFTDNVGIDTDSIKIYKYNSTTKKYDKEIKKQVLKENEIVNNSKRTTVKVERKNISTKNEAVKIKIVAKDKDSSVNSTNAYLVIRPLTKENNKKWYGLDNAPRMKFTNAVECMTDENTLKKKLNIKLVDNKGIKSLEVYDLNSSEPTTAKQTVTVKTRYTLDLSKYTVKKAPSGKDACKIRFVVQDINGRKLNEVVYITARKYERVAATSLKLSSENLTIDKGKTKTLKATIEPKNTTDKIKYTSSDKNIATVDSTGKITAKSGGTATITATVGNLKKECKVTVKEVKVEKVTLNKTDITLEQMTYKRMYEKKVKGTPTAQLKATITPSNATDKTIKYTSSNTKVATVDKNGKITGHFPGTATITAIASNGKKATCKVSVNLKTAPGYTKSTASVSQKNIEVKKGEVFNLDVYFTEPYGLGNDDGYWFYVVKEVGEYDKISAELFEDQDHKEDEKHSLSIEKKNTLRLKATEKGKFHFVFGTIRKIDYHIMTLSNEVEIVVK